MYCVCFRYWIYSPKKKWMSIRSISSSVIFVLSILSRILERDKNEGKCYSDDKMNHLVWFSEYYCDWIIHSSMFRSHWIEWFDPIRIEIPFGYSNSTTLSFIHSISITHLIYNIGIFHNDKSIISIRSFCFHFNIPDFITISILLKLSYIVSFTQTINC